jgi:DUF917 family protein
MRVSKKISTADLRSLAIGAGILGTGGGTHPYLELLNIEKLYREGKTVSLVDPADLSDDDLVAEVGYMGAPLVTKERLPDPDQMCRPVRIMEDFARVRFQAVMAGEIGSENGVLPLLIAARMDLPVVDADGMGRSFPEMQMSSFVIHGLPLYPFALADIRDNDVIITRSADAVWVERIGRKVCAEFGSFAATCRPPRTGREVKSCAIFGSVSKAIRIGEAVRRAREAHADPVRAVLAVEGGVMLFKGKVQDVERRTTEGFVRGGATLKGLDEYGDQAFSVAFQNEFTIGRLDGKVRVSVPDLICVVDSVSGEAIGTETIRYGQRVTVISLRAAAVLRSPAGLGIVGPRAFGYDLDYVSVHEREGR